MICVDQVSYGYYQIFVLDYVILYESELVISVIWGRNGVGKIMFMSLFVGYNCFDQGSI